MAVCTYVICTYVNVRAPRCEYVEHTQVYIQVCECMHVHVCVCKCVNMCAHV